jgi:hypothetical protein
MTLLEKFENRFAAYDSAKFWRQRSIREFSPIGAGSNIRASELFTQFAELTRIAD